MNDGQIIALAFLLAAALGLVIGAYFPDSYFIILVVSFIISLLTIKRLNRS
jgi:uncharacterized membrane protein YgaE (UPF0421/DUF939 family)